MVELDVIERISKPTDWVSSLAYSRKSSWKIRICLDPKNLNEAIRRPHYPTPTLEEMTYKLEGAKVFSKLDARSGYWSVTLDDESSTLTTFNTPFGRFRFKRMPFGLNLSQDIFQERMDILQMHIHVCIHAYTIIYIPIYIHTYIYMHIPLYHIYIYIHITLYYAVLHTRRYLYSNVYFVPIYRHMRSTTLG